jgi:hypothetical protein
MQLNTSHPLHANLISLIGVPVASPDGSVVRYWHLGAWVEGRLKVFRSGAWEGAALRSFGGGVWVDI